MHYWMVTLAGAIDCLVLGIFVLCLSPKILLWQKHEKRAGYIGLLSISFLMAFCGGFPFGNLVGQTQPTIRDWFYGIIGILLIFTGVISLLLILIIHHNTYSDDS